jgi:hypothetical protein
MKTVVYWAVGILLLAVSGLSEATIYVSSSSQNPTPPYDTWATAATNIQFAVNVAQPGQVVVVTNGVYPGGVTVNKPVTLLSLNGPEFTVINGNGSDHCISIDSGVSLSGFTLTNGFAQNGGGVWCSSSNVYITNCVIAGNSGTNGGGAYGGTLYNCRLTGNRVLGLGGGAYGSTLYNCTVSGNSAFQGGGGVILGTLYNSIVYYNSAQYYMNFLDEQWLYNCCTMPMPTNGVGNITNAPLFADQAGGDFQLQPESPCINTGNNAYVSNTTDLLGNPRIYDGIVDMGAYEFRSSGPPVILEQPVSQTVTVGTNVTFTVRATGSHLSWQWEFNDTPILDATNSTLTLTSVTIGQAGSYSVIVSNSLGIVPSVKATLIVRQSSVSYVWQNSPNPGPPYDSWATAATNIQNAVDASLPGSLVIVTNGVYPGAVSVNKRLTLLSVNGPRLTFIDGGGADQCLAIIDGVNVAGFTLTNGRAQNGGGVSCNSTNAYLTNCIVVGNAAAQNGGGAFGTTLYNCVLTGNSAANGLGGGACFAMLYNCTVTGNSANSGGGAAYGIFYNSILYYNIAPNGANYTGGYYLPFCCTTPAPMYGVGSITDPPLFIDYAGGNLHLPPNSPCIDAGNNAFVYNTTDLDGNPRIFDSAVDIGAYESQLPSAPFITQQPPSQAALAGTTVNFSVGLRGSPPFSWQWLFEGTRIPDATNSILTLSPVMTNQAGGYSVMVTNVMGSVTSQVAILTVEGAPPQINQQPLNQTVYVGSNVEFTVGTVSLLPLAFQWRHNGSAIAGGTDWLLTIPSVQTNQAGGYSVVITNFLGSVTSQVAVLTVLDAAPSITVQPISQTALAGSTVTFTVGASGSLPMFWHWQLNKNAIPGAINPTLTLPTVTTDESGVYSVIVSNALGKVTSADATLTVQEPRSIYVWQDSPGPTPPYTNWATAAHVIQDAVDTASLGDEILVTNGIYATGGRTVVPSLLTNRVILNKPLRLRSVNGPDVTVIQGYQVPGATNGDAAIRCVYITSNAVLSGFTLTGGATWQSPFTGQVDPDFSGGGIYCDVWNGALAVNCKLIANSASDSGGGSFYCSLYGCLVVSNSAGGYGGGVFTSPVTNCTVVGNSAMQGGGVFGSFYNSISYYNYVTDSCCDGTNYILDKGIFPLSSCTTPNPPVAEWQNISAEPLFVDLANGDFHLQAGSPCINAGNNAFVSSTTDLDGNPRIVGASVDIGAYEFQPSGSVIPLAWLQQYGLPTDGSADFIDSDGDGMNNWQEWVSGTVPTNSLSVLRLLSATPNGSDVTVSWQSVAGVNYYVTRGTNLGASFIPSKTNFVIVATNIIGQAGTTSYTDTNVIGSFFYRVGVQSP